MYDKSKGGNHSVPGSYLWVSFKNWTVDSYFPILLFTGFYCGIGSKFLSDRYRIL